MYLKEMEQYFLGLDYLKKNLFMHQEMYGNNAQKPAHVGYLEAEKGNFKWAKYKEGKKKPQSRKMHRAKC